MSPLPLLYSWQPLREKYLKELKTIVELFYKKIYPVFSNAEDDAETLQEKAWNDFMEQPCSSEAYIDPADAAETFIEFGIEQYEILSLMRYRTLAMWITCLCQAWEQQLIKFVIDEGRKSGIKYNPDYIKKGFLFVKDVFLNHGVEVERLNCWKKIKELRQLVNTLKHADGPAADELRKLRPDYFKKNDLGSLGFDTLEVYGSTLLDETLNLGTNDFNDYLEALIAFWNELPENMYWCGKEIPYAK